MTTQHSNILILCLATLLLSACSTQTSKPMTPEEWVSERGFILGEEVDRIRNIEIDGWQYLNSQALIIPYRANKSYLVTLNRVCPYLNYTQLIAFTSTGPSVQAKFDAVRVVDRASQIEDKCYIDHIYTLTREKNDESEATSDNSDPDEKPPETGDSD